MKKVVIFMAVMLLMFSGCTAQTDSSVASQTASPQTEGTVSVEPSEEETQKTEAGKALEEAANKEEQLSDTESTESEDAMRLLIGETEVPVTWEENVSVEALMALCPLTIQMSMYGGFEQVGPIGQSIVRDDVQTNTSFGDIVLYSGSQIVIFYGSNSWAYTRLGHVDLSQQEMSKLLGGGDVAITLESSVNSGK